MSRTFGNWMKWDGGECPVAPHVEVQVKYRDEMGRHSFSEDLDDYDDTVPAEGLRWGSVNRIPCRGDIVEYRIADVPSPAEDAFAGARIREKVFGDVKPTNPKDLIGSAKLPLNLVPDSLQVYACMAFAEGASKYGAFNWRVAPVRASIYLAAHARHMKKFNNGEWCDVKTKVPHLASSIACLAIIADARECGTLIDDRPPALEIAKLIAEAEEVVKHVFEMHKAMSPHHCTIADKVPS